MDVLQSCRPVTRRHACVCVQSVTQLLQSNHVLSKAVGRGAHSGACHTDTRQTVLPVTNSREKIHLCLLPSFNCLFCFVLLLLLFFVFVFCLLFDFLFCLFCLMPPSICACCPPPPPPPPPPYTCVCSCHSLAFVDTPPPSPPPPLSQLSTRVCCHPLPVSAETLRLCLLPCSTSVCYHPSIVCCCHSPSVLLKPSTCV